MSEAEPDDFDRLWAERQRLKASHGGDCGCDLCERVLDRLRVWLLKDKDEEEGEYA